MVESTGPLRRKGFSGRKGSCTRKERKDFCIQEERKKIREEGKKKKKREGWSERSGFFLSVEECKVGRTRKVRENITASENRTMH